MSNKTAPELNVYESASPDMRFVLVEEDFGDGSPIRATAIPKPVYERLMAQAERRILSTLLLRAEDVLDAYQGDPRAGERVVALIARATASVRL